MMEEVKFHEISTQFVPPALTPDHLVIDGLFGSGLNKPLSGGFAAVVKYINSSPAMVVAIDIPSGLMGEENTFNVKAILSVRTSLSACNFLNWPSSLPKYRICWRMGVIGHPAERRRNRRD